ncbi:hypothetical protein L1887_27283, partial [Cichorium endivia]
ESKNPGARRSVKQISVDLLPSIMSHVFPSFRLQTKPSSKPSTHTDRSNFSTYFKHTHRSRTSFGFPFSGLCFEL